MYKIEKDIPITKQTNKLGESLLYPYGQMEVGDSFFVALKGRATPKELKRLQGRVFSSSYGYTKDGKRFISRTTKDGPTHGVRVWRVD